MLITGLNINKIFIIIWSYLNIFELVYPMLKADGLLPEGPHLLVPHLEDQVEAGRLLAQGHLPVPNTIFCNLNLESEFQQ